MTYGRTLEFYCDHDGCAAVNVCSADLVNDAREEIRREGWSSSRGKEYCPEHRSKRGSKRGGG